MTIRMFLDGGYLEELTKANQRRVGDPDRLAINYGELRDEILRQFHLDQKYLTDVFFYHALPGDPARATGKIGFFKSLETNFGFHNRIGRVQMKQCENPECYIKKPHQKQVDTMLSIDVLRAIWIEDEVKDIVLVTGDSDFLPLFDEARNYGTHIYLYHGPDNTTAEKLRDYEGWGFTKRKFDRKDLELLPSTIRHPFVTRRS